MSLREVQILTDKVADAVRTTYRYVIKEDEAQELARAAITANIFGEDVGVALIQTGTKLGMAIDQPVDLRIAVIRVINDHRREKMEELVTVIGDMNPHGKDPDAALKFYDVVWAAICHQTDRAGRYYTGESPEARLYQMLGLAFHVFGKAE